MKLNPGVIRLELWTQLQSDVEDSVHSEHSIDLSRCKLCEESLLKRETIFMKNH